MINFSATIQKFQKQGEKTGWTYITVTEEIAAQLIPNNKKSIRVKGLIDYYELKGIALLPMGNGDFIMALNAGMRKQIRKPVGAVVQVKLSLDTTVFKVPAYLLECMADEPGVTDKFLKLLPSHQRYYVQWIESAKTETTRAKRIAMTINSFVNNLDFAQMLRAARLQKPT